MAEDYEKAKTVLTVVGISPFSPELFSRVFGAGAVSAHFEFLM